MIDYSVLEFRWKPEVIKEAIHIAKHEAVLYKESYYTNDGDFQPHVWVVAAICAGMEIV